ncbi:hypothetical protein QJS04_geneDACA015833 [Acorus gramineus]|uniref:BHLH domain-containing protein n=1 Tax=Acorus gramineus TaxID=55184 RepID=A0AAV9BNW4_ACOGR|nr:hypothetical protein QJS04_geneDACA015833 [Acorus gramineus]
MEIEKKQQLSMYDQSSYFCPPPPSQAAAVVPPMSFSGFTPMISSSSEEINHQNHHHQNYCPHHLGLDMKQDFYNGQSMMANPDSLYNLSFEEYPINGAASSSSFEYALQYGFPGSLYDHEREGTTIGMGGGGDSELLGLECGLMERRRGRGGGGGGGGGDMGKVGFASEKQRREKISEKYEALRSMIPNPTKFS